MSVISKPVWLCILDLWIHYYYYCITSKASVLVNNLMTWSSFWG